MDKAVKVRRTSSPDAGVGSSQVTSTQSSLRIIGSSTNTSCSMPGSRYTGVQGLRGVLAGGLKAGRLDKVAMLGLKPDEIEVLQPGLVEADRPWSDHCGLRSTFTIYHGKQVVTS